MRTSHLIACIAIFCFVALSTQNKVGEYERLTPKQVYKDDAAKAALNFGADKIIEKLIALKKIPKHDYHIEKILYAARQVVAGINYKFKVVIENKEIQIIAEYVVFRDYKGKYSLSSSDYKIEKERKDYKDKKDKKDRKDYKDKKDKKDYKDKKDKKDKYHKKDDKKDDC